MHCGCYVSRLTTLFKLISLGLETMMGKACCKCLGLLEYQLSQRIFLLWLLKGFLHLPKFFFFRGRGSQWVKARTTCTWWSWMKTCQLTRSHYKSTGSNIAWIWNSWLCLPFLLIFCYIHWHLSMYWLLHVKVWRIHPSLLWAFWVLLSAYGFSAHRWIQFCSLYSG